jgi:hypothetical protein
MIRLLLCFALLAVPARAEMPSGHEDPSFQAAKQAWLDADPSAEAQLDKLAAEEHEAAVILRFRLMMSAGSFSGRKINGYPKLEWADAVSGSELARMLGVLTWSEPLDLAPVDVANGLLELGEPFAAKQIYKKTRMAAALRQFSSNPEARAQDYAEMQELPKALIVQAPSEVNRLALMLGLGPMLDTEFMLSEWEKLCEKIQRGDVDLAPAASICAALEAGDSARLRELETALFRAGKDSVPSDVATREVALWLAEDKGLPFRALCKAVCPQSMGICASFVFQKIHQLGGLDGMGSPVEALISQTEYLASRRAVAELWAQIAEVHSFSTYNEEKRAEFFEGDPEQCFANALEQGGEQWRK